MSMPIIKTPWCCLGLRTRRTEAPTLFISIIPFLPVLLFYSLPSADTLDTVRQQGLQPDPGDELHLQPSLEAAHAAAPGPVLVIDPTALPSPPEGDASVRVSSVPATAICNLRPYRPPTPVTAGGGYVACSLPDDVALLLIHRRGVWDLPKGKQDPGEDIQTCARREVKEEVGINTLDVRRDLSTTQHGYPNGDTYAVKTTYWYLMQTPERSFEPERREGIRRVAWAQWPVAHRHIGYNTLRRHMTRIESTVRAAVRSATDEQ